jgi:hypothetical protein
MHRKTIGIVAGALVAASCAAPVAQAGTPAKVTVRVEAPARTLVSTTLTTTRTPVVKDGDPAHRCTGTSAAGALERATAGRWTGSWYNSLGYMVDAILGVSAPADLSAYWTLWVNGRSSTTGVCDTELQAGDEVLEFLCTSTPDFASCENLPLAIKVLRVHLGTVTLKVVRLKGDGTSEPVAGATIRGGERVVRSGSGGRAVVVLDAPGGALRAAHAGDVPSASLHCSLDACGRNDRVAPRLWLRGIPHRAHFAAADAPRELHGVARDAGGLAGVSFRLTRRAGGLCAAFDGARERFRPCSSGVPLVAIGDDARWSYLLPSRLAPGDYTLRLIATDKAGNRTRLVVRFVVEA